MWTLSRTIFASRRFPFCDGNRSASGVDYLSIPGRLNFAEVSPGDFETYIQQNMGSTGVYDTIHKFLSAHGLQWAWAWYTLLSCLELMDGQFWLEGSAVNSFQLGEFQ